MMWAFFAIMVAMMASRRWHGGGDWGLEGSRRRGRRAELDRRLEALEAEVAQRDDTIGLLEARVNELESRLDFTERMLLTAHAEPPDPSDRARV